MSLGAHLWTLWPLLRPSRGLPPAPPGEPWTTTVDDPVTGRVPLTGVLHRVAGARTVVVLVHGLGGSRDSRYMLPTAGAAAALGLAALRLDLRGADRRGDDLHHAGLGADVAAAIASPALAAYDAVVVLGFSLGGHLVLRYAVGEAIDPRLRAVAAVCSPLHLARAQAAFDEPSRWAYRRYILGGLAELYAAYAARHVVPHPVEEVRRVRTLRDFDRLVVVPRFGFADPDDYYRRESVASRLDHLHVPALLVAAEGDPMVPPVAIRHAVEEAPGTRLEVRWLRRGGHVSFPAGLDLGVAGPRGLAGQVLAWLAAHAASPAATAR